MKRLIAPVVSVLVVLVLCMPAFAVVDDTVLTGTLGNVPLHATATFASGVWTYSYTVDVSNLTRTVTAFTIANLNSFLFSNATNDKNFVDPVYTVGSTSVLWELGTVVPADHTATFTYQSAFAPGAVPYVTLVSGAKQAAGQTIGMTPEPSSIASLAFCGLGAAGSLIWRRKARR